MNTPHTNRACPHLGLHHDADTSLAFPSKGNFCHFKSPVVSPGLSHQAEYCLAENHKHCLVFLGQEPLPHPRNKSNSGRPLTGSRNLIFALTGIAILILLGVGFMASGAVVNKTSSATVAAIESVIPEISTTRKPFITPQPYLSATPLLEPIIVAPNPSSGLSLRRLDVEIGSKYKFVIHKVQSGENMNLYGDKYATTVEAILEINPSLKLPMRVGAIVVIPVGISDVSTLPVFEVYEVKQSGMTVEEIADEMNSSVDDIKYYNALGNEETMLAGDWLLIPHSRATT